MKPRSNKQTNNFKLIWSFHSNFGSVGILLAISPKDHVDVGHLAKQKYERMPLALNVIRKKRFCVLQKKVLLFGPNRTLEVRPNQTFGRSLDWSDDYEERDFKKPVTRSSFLSKSVVIFTDFVLISAKMTNTFCKKWGLRNWLLKMNGL